MFLMALFRKIEPFLFDDSMIINRAADLSCHSRPSVQCSTNGLVSQPEGEAPSGW